MTFINGPHNRPICAHWRIPIDVMTSGLAMSLFQASQAASMISAYVSRTQFREAVGTQILPDVLDRVQFQTLTRFQISLREMVVKKRLAILIEDRSFLCRKTCLREDDFNKGASARLTVSA
jgi:hypothetical protein